MIVIKAIILGIIQGITEFLPISSTAHLTICGMLMGMVDPQNPHKWTAFIAVMQLGTTVAVIYYFYNDIVSVYKYFIRENFTKLKIPFKEQSLNSRMGWMIIVGSIPIAALGLGLKKIIEGDLTKNVFFICATMFLFAILLFIADIVAKYGKNIEEITIKDSIIIGISQAMALIPGASRSGTSITAGLFLGFNRETAARFSFLLSIPSITAAGLLQFVQSFKYLDSNEWGGLVLSTLISGFVGYFAIDFLLRYLKTNNSTVFVIYRIGFALIVSAYFLFLK